MCYKTVETNELNKIAVHNCYAASLHLDTVNRKNTSILTSEFE